MPFEYFENDMEPDTGFEPAMGETLRLTKPLLSTAQPIRHSD